MDGLTTNLWSNTTDGISAEAFNFVGHNLYENSEYQNIKLPLTTVTHAMVGGVMSEIKGGDFSSGAIATATGHTVAEFIGDYYVEDIVNSETTMDVVQTQIVAISSAASVIAVATTHKDIDSQDLPSFHISRYGMREYPFCSL
jgi:hypothetical protein